MMAALRQVGLPDPLFDDRISSFRVTFENTSRRRRARDRRSDILNLLRDHGQMSRAELSDALGISDIATRKWLQTLRAEGAVDTTGEKSQSKNLRYKLIVG